MGPLSLKNAGPTSIINLQCFKTASKKKARSSYKRMINNVTSLSSSDYEMASKEKKNRRSTFRKKRICIVTILKPRMMHCLRIGQKYLPLY